MKLEFIFIIIIILSIILGCVTFYNIFIHFILIISIILIIHIYMNKLSFFHICVETIFCLIIFEIIVYIFFIYEKNHTVTTELDNFDDYSIVSMNILLQNYINIRNVWRNIDNKL